MLWNFFKIVNFKLNLTNLRFKKSLLIVKLRSFQNASIEIKQIYFVYQ